MYLLQKFQPPLKCVTTLPFEICILIFVIELALIIQPKVNWTSCG